MIEKICRSCMQQYNITTDDMNEEEAEFCPFCGVHEDEDPNQEDYVDWN